MPGIYFFQEDIHFSLASETGYIHWITHITHHYNKSLQELNYIFCSDEYLLQVNRQYLEHDYYTDIITFDNSEDDTMLAGDIFISIDRVKENARIFAIDFTEELQRVMVHGILHLLGYGDKSEEEKNTMRGLENHWVKSFPTSL